MKKTLFILFAILILSSLRFKKESQCEEQIQIAYRAGFKAACEIIKKEITK